MAQIMTGECDTLLFSLQDPLDVQHSLYMFHPTLPGILLELANVSANIVAFDGKHELRHWVQVFPSHSSGWS